MFLVLLEQVQGGFMVPNTAVEYEGVVAGLRTPASMPFVFIVEVSVLLVGVDGPGSFTEFRT